MAIVFFIDVIHLSRLTGSGRAQSEMLLIAPIIGSLAVTSLCGIVLFVLLILFLLDKKRKFNQNDIMFILYAFFSPLLLWMIYLIAL
jgi:hypothetical protein